MNCGDLFYVNFMKNNGKYVVVAVDIDDREIKYGGAFIVLDGQPTIFIQKSTTLFENRERSIFYSIIHCKLFRTFNDRVREMP